MRSTRAALSIGLIAIAALAGGCGQSEVKTPVACLNGPQAFNDALGAAPGKVRLSGDVPISGCLVKNQPDGALVDVGTSLVTVATNLSRQMDAIALTNPSQATKAGYLVGAVEKGAAETDGIHATLVQRITSAATNNVTTPARKAQYALGYKAGKADG
jgi:hypothetical protein